MVPGQTSGAIDVRFAAPARDRFGSEISILAPTNRPPRFTSTPVLQTSISQLYSYNSTAVDADGGRLTYALQSAPSGMTIDPSTGKVSWAATAADIGRHAIAITVADGRGGLAQQTYSLVVQAVPQNLPPVITSSPIVSLASNLGYRYQVRARDMDGDTLVYSLTSAAPGLTIDPDTGLITSAAIPNGNYPVEITVSDTRGGVAIQNYNLRVGLIGLAVPTIVSTPPTVAYQDSIYSYTVAVQDASQTVLTFSLQQFPAGMEINSATGRITWQPTAAQIAAHPIIVQVSNGLGRVALQSYTLQAVVARPNQAPQFDSQPIRVATIDQPYTYASHAVDPEAQTLTYSLAVAPAGLVIDPLTGVVTGTVSTVGLQRVTLVAQDTQGLRAIQSYLLDVRVPNTAPQFVTSPLTTIQAGAAYRYDARATDLEDSITYALIAGSAGINGMQIDRRSGAITWQPSLSEIGQRNVVIRATDDRGLFTDQSYTLTVQPDTTAPKVAIVFSKNPVNVGETVTVTVVASDNLAIATVGLTLGGVPLVLNAQRQATFTASTVGFKFLSATATDTSGNSASSDDVLSVLDPTDTTAPIVDITSPANGATVTYLTDILGSISDANVASYTLEVSPINLDQWTTIAQRTVGPTASLNISNGLLGTFDPTLLRNDQYRIRLTATDIGGLSSSDTIVVALDGHAKLGVNEQTAIDLTIPVAGGPPIQIMRQHSQLTADISGAFGNGWQFCSAQPDIRESVARTPYEDLLGQFAARPFREGDKVYITTPDCQRAGFTFSPVQHTGVWSSVGNSFFDPRWIPDPGVDWQLYGENDFTKVTGLASGQFDLNGLPLPLLKYADNQFILGAISASYNPLGYQLIGKDGTRYHYGQTDGLLDVTDRNGNTLTYSETGIASSSGQQLQFQRDAQGRITKIIDPQNNEFLYSYDASGNLVDVHYPEGLSNSYYYTAQNYLAAINPEKLPEQETIAKGFEYDIAGRLKSTLMANESVYHAAYDLINRLTTVTDPQGSTTSAIYDGRGNVVQSTDEIGLITRNQYDSNDNLLFIRYASGDSVAFTYDSNRNVTSIIDQTGAVTTLTYGTGNQILSETDALGRTIEYQYDLHRNLVTVIDPSGKAGRTSYDEAGRPTSATDPKGNVTRFEYSGGGSLPTRIINADGTFSSFTHDAYGRALGFTNENGETTTTTRDSAGRVLSLTNALGQTSTIQYVGNYPSKYIEFDGSTHSVLYNSQGDIIRETDAGGEITQYFYDSKRRRTKVIDPLGREHRTEYRPDGLASRMIDATGAITSYQYDDNKHLTQITDDEGFTETRQFNGRGDLLQNTDKLGHTAQFVYDKAQRLTQLIDARGNSTQYVYDVLNNLISQSDALGRVTHYEYDANGNMVKGIDANGNQFQATYDSRDRQSRIVDALGGVQNFTFDAAGRKTQWTDELGRTELVEYDSLGRTKKHTNAMGGITRYVYDDITHTTTTIDPLGRTSLDRFDVLDRLVMKTDTNGNSDTYTYDAVGNLRTSTDRLGRISRFSDDAMNRLVRDEDPSGSVTARAYDRVGNLVSITDALGAVTQMQYDAKDRLIKTTYADGSTDQSEYDAVGNMISRTDPLNRISTFVYDAANQLTISTDPRGSATRFQYDANGNQTRVTDASGNVTQFQYDGLNRLTEQVDPLSHATTYVYDAIGNLTSKTDRNGRVVGFAYDLLDRVTSETWFGSNANSQKQFIYSYDAVGNLLSAADESVEHSFTYDALNRSTSSQTIAIRGGDLTLNSAYDEVGNRTSVADTLGVSVTSSFTARNQLASLRWQGGGIAAARIDFAYDQRGAQVQSTRFSNVAAEVPVGSTVKTYDMKGRLESINHRNAVDALLSHYDYGYDLADQLISETTGGDQLSYNYDNAGQLTSANATVRPNENFTYDASGNRTSPSNVTERGNRLAADAANNYSYDFEGNLVTKTERASGTVTQFQYDYRNRLISVNMLSAGGVSLMTAEYVYDVFDRRIVTSVDRDGSGPLVTVETNTVYDGEHAWADLQSDGTLVTKYLYGDRTDEILARWTPAAGTAWYLMDRLGSVTQIAGASGQVIDSISYGSFGNVVSESNPSVGDRFKYTGRELDAETGNYYYRSRYYDPGTGRFLSEDSLGFNAGDTNLYRYGTNAPTSGTDPSGHIWIIQSILGGMAGAAIGGVGGYVTGAWCNYWHQWADIYAEQRDEGCSCQCESEPRDIDWDKVHNAGLKSMETASAFGFIFGASFSILPMPLGLTLGIGVGTPTAVLALADYNQKIDKAWANRGSAPEQLFATTMCLFGDASVGAVQSLAGAAASKGIKRLDSDKLVDDIVQFLNDESGTFNPNISEWKFPNSQAQKVIQSFGQRADTGDFPRLQAPLILTGREKKLFQHAHDWGIGTKGAAPGNAAQLMAEIVLGIYRSARQIRQGRWHQCDDAIFYFDGSNIVVTEPSGVLITVLKNASNNKWFNKAEILVNQ